MGCNLTCALRIGLTGLCCGFLASTCAEPVIAVDVGHSRLVPGAISARGKPEFEFNQELAATIHATLANHGLATVAVGDEGAIGHRPGLVVRTREARQQHASLYLAVHHDSAKAQFLDTWEWQGHSYHYSDRFSGFSLFVSRKNPHLKTSLRCASSIGHALIKAGLHPATHHADRVAGENRKWADKAAGVYYFDQLIVLKTAKMPAVLLEAGVIINREDEQTLQTDAMRETIANAVADGVTACQIGPAK